MLFYFRDKYTKRVIFVRQRMAALEDNDLEFVESNAQRAQICTYNTNLCKNRRCKLILHFRTSFDNVSPHYIVC